MATGCAGHMTPWEPIVSPQMHNAVFKTRCGHNGDKKFSLKQYQTISHFLASETGICALKTRLQMQTISHELPGHLRQRSIKISKVTCRLRGTTWLTCENHILLPISAPCVLTLLNNTTSEPPMKG